MGGAIRKLEIECIAHTQISAIFYSFRPTPIKHLNQFKHPYNLFSTPQIYPYAGNHTIFDSRPLLASGRHIKQPFAGTIYTDLLKLENRRREARRLFILKPII